MIQEEALKIPAREGHRELLYYLAHYFEEQYSKDRVPIRFAISKTDSAHYHCEVGVLENPSKERKENDESIFHFRERASENNRAFNAMAIVPTGVGSKYGGHAGDAGAIAKLLGSSCDNLILNPNMVNASDINEMPENTLYVEGSVMARLLCGTIGLERVRKNRLLMVIDDHKDEMFVNAVVNSVNAARVTYGLDCPEVVKLNPPIQMQADYSKSGRAVGRIENTENLFQLLDEYASDFDAVAFSSVIEVPEDYHTAYFEQEGAMINPWGGVEAMLTHSISHFYNLPSAHSPMLEDRWVANMDPGQVDPRMSAEAVSFTYLQSILKGLHQSPRIVDEEARMQSDSAFSAEDISCLIIPDGCLGIPTMAALEQGIPVIAVRDNENVMENDLSELPWGPDQLQYVDNYLEAVGVMKAMQAGISLNAVKRPIHSTLVHTKYIDQPSVDQVDTDKLQVKKKAEGSEAVPDRNKA